MRARTVATILQTIQLQCTHNVTVEVSDGAGGSDAKAVSIMVGDRHEPVVAPARPMVRATEDWSTRLDVSWNAPENTGAPITSYEVRYREGTSGEFLNDNCGTVAADNCATITGTKTTILGLNAGASHQVQVLTIIAGGRKSVWSDVGTGSTNQANREPRFDDRPSSGVGSTTGSDYTTSRTVDEDTSSGRHVGRPVRAEDGDGHPRTYKLAPETPDDAASEAAVAKFDINKSTGQILTKDPLNTEAECSDADATPGHQENCTYTVKVEVRDGYDTHKVKEEEESETADDTITVTINVRDKVEVPVAPTVTLTAPSGNVTLGVIWDAPANKGPTITGYDVQYRKGSGSFSNDNCASEAPDNCDGISDTNTTIIGLDANTSYSVQVRARNDEGPSLWSRLITIKTNMGTNAPPDFLGTLPNCDAAPESFNVAENTPSGQVVGTVTACDNDSERWSYSLGGADAASFNFNAGTGDIRTKSSLNFEEKTSYSVRVKASDSNDGGSSSHTVTIDVDDVDERPNPPAAPRVTATKDSGWSLYVTWNEPLRNTGKPPITEYDIRYREKGEGDDAWQDWDHGVLQATDDSGDTDRSATITTIGTPAVHLEPGTEYEVEVRATNDEGTSDWSGIGTGRTGAGNRRPSFDIKETVVTLTVDENTRSGNVGSAVSATDADSNRLTYSLEGPNKDLFTIISSSGQIRTKVVPDYETRQSYSLTVKVDDGSRKANSSAAKSVTIEVNDVDEIPPPPGPPTVSGISGSTDSVLVTWDASANKGPAITDYEVRYGEAGRDGWTTLVGRTGADRSQIITGLTAGKRYQVQIRAKSDEGTGEWSRSGTGSPNPDVANRPPSFLTGTRSFNVPENTVAGTDVGSLVTATDRDGDTLTYTLEGTDAPSFSLLSTGGGAQIQTSASLNHEEKARYSVTVRVRDGRGGTDAVNLTINVTDVDGEAPDTPVAPTVTAVSSTSLQVSWDAPDNTGPPITDYDYRYRETGDWTEVTGTRITGTSVTIEGLTALTLYEVEVRATNAEGTSAWSNSGFESTNAPGANNPPVFEEGTSATRSVRATAQAGASIGQPVTATDSDSGDTLTYSLEGTDSASFGINSANGQLMTIAGVTLVAGTTYTVEVVADDTKDATRITVTIEAIAGPPNNAPVFSEGTSATRSVSAAAAAGTNVGGPVAATDADSGDTLTYSLEGTDGASFDIVATSGQIRTKTGVTLTAGTTYNVTVVASDTKDSTRITVTINAVANRPPVFSAGARSFTVRDNASAGTSIGSVTATDSDAGDTVTYSLEGTGGASFDIVSTSGLIRTRAGVTLTAGATHSVTVVATDRNAGRATVAVTITVIQGSFGCGTNGAVDSSNSGLVDDCEALLRARDRLQDGGARLNWFERTPIDRWQGITLGGTPLRVTEVDLNRMGLSGTVPAELGDVDRLTKLNLRSNDLSGAIPASLGNLRYLEVLNLHSNMLNGEIPNLSGTVLQELYLTNNVRWNRDEDDERISRVQGTGLSGGVPAWLNNMTDLRELWLWGNNLEGTMPDLSRMRSLDKLKLSGNTGLTGFSGAKLPSGLRWLVASETDVGATAPDLSGMTSMTTLWLNKTGLSGAIPVASIPTSVSNLNLKDNSLRTIPDMSGLDNLRYLYLHRNDLGGEIPGTLGDMESIERIWLHENELTGIADGFRNAADTLTHLYLDGNNFDAGTCLPGDLADVLNNDFAAAGLAACQ